MCDNLHMATNLALDDHLIEAARQAGGHKTKKEAVTAALDEYVKRRKQLPLESQEFEEAAAMSNHCRSRGIAGSPIDFLICAVAHRRTWQIFTLDRDFTLYAKALPVVLYAGS